MAFFLDCQRKRRSLETPVPSKTDSHKRESGFMKLKGAAAIACMLVGTSPSYAIGQQQPTQAVASPASELPPEPVPNATQPLYLRPTARDFTVPRHHFPNPFAPYQATTVDAPRIANSPRLDDLVKNGKIYLSLSDAILLALENNYDIAIQRYNLDIADTDILRTKAGSTSWACNNGLVTGTRAPRVRR